MSNALQQKQGLFLGLAQLRSAKFEYEATATVYGMLIELQDNVPFVKKDGTSIDDVEEYVKAYKKLYKECKIKKQNFPLWGSDFDEAYMEVEEHMLAVERAAKKHTKAVNKEAA